MSAPQDWHIRKRADRCHGTDAPFEAGDAVVSRLVLDEEQGYAREDYSLEAWKQVADDRTLSSWRGTYTPPAPPDRKEPVQKETAESLLRKLIETDDPENRNTIYILALMLERKRLFEEKEVLRSDDEGLTRVYELKKSGETFIIPDPGLHLDEIAAIQADVVARLG